MATTRPNVLWFMTDQHRHDAVGYAGHPDVRTPHLDRLAAQGIRFDRFYVTNPVCTPSRATMVTGRYPHAHGSWQVDVTLPEHEVTLPALLARHGYATAVIGKLHLQHFHEHYQPGRPQEIESIHRNLGVPPAMVDEFWRSWGGPLYGFAHCELVLQHGNRCVGGGHYDQWLRTHHPAVLASLEPRHALVPPTGALQSWKPAMPAALHYATWIADRTIAYLEAHQDEPFFVSCSFPDPHFPLAPPVPYANLYNPATLAPPLPNRGELAVMPPHHRYYYEGRVAQIPYAPGGVAGATAKDYPLHQLPEAHWREMLAHYYGLITLCDDAIGRVLAALDRLGLSDNTIVLFNADHGELAGDHGLWFKGPFHYESILRVPMLWRWPGVIAPGGVYRGLSSAVDIVPTLLDACGLPPEAGVQGVSALPVLRGSAAPYRAWALAEHRERVPGMQTKTLVTERYKLTYYPGHTFGELFDLERDPQEYENLWATPAAQALRGDLLLHLLEVLCATEDPLPVYRSSPLP